MKTNSWNSFLDFNGDGKVDVDEEVLGFMMMQEFLEAEDQNGDEIDDDFPDDDEYPR